MATTVEFSVNVPALASYVAVHIKFTPANAVTRCTVERQDPGQPWVYIRAGAVIDIDPATGVPTATVEDHEAPMDVPVIYRLSPSNPAGAFPVTTTPGRVLTSYDKVWLKDPAFGSYDKWIEEVTNIPTLVYGSRAGVFDIIDREEPVVVAAKRQSWTGDLKFTTRTDGDRQDFEDMLSRGQVLLLCVPPRYGMGNAYVHVGDVQCDRIGLADEPTRAWTLPLTCVDRPTPLGLVSLGMHWIDVYYKYATWQDLVDTGYQWSDVLTDTPL